MAPFKQSQKRRKSSESGRNVRNRTESRATSTQSNARSGSRHSTVSRTSSTQSLRGNGRRRSFPPPASTRSERPVSAATNRTFATDAQSTATAAAAPEDLEADLDVQAEVVMAVNLAERGTVGCAYYVARDEKLYFMEDMRLGGPHVIDSCKSLSLPPI